MISGDRFRGELVRLGVSSAVVILTFICSYFQQRATFFQFQEVLHRQEVVIYPWDLSVSGGAGRTCKQDKKQCY